MFFFRKDSVAIFFVLTYVISWGCWIAAAMLRQPLGAFAAVIAAIGMLGPGIAGFLATGIARGHNGVADLVRRILAWRVSWKAYLVALGIPFFLAFFPLWLFSFFSGPPIQLGNLVRLPALIPLFLAMLVAGGLNEEPGWRGFALPVLRARHGSLIASVIVGVFWGIWHVPLYLMGTPILMASLIGFIILVLLVSFLFTALANFTNDSVWIAIVFHAAYNTFIPNVPSLLGVPQTPQHQMIAVLLVVAMLFVVLWRWRRSAR